MKTNKTTNWHITQLTTICNNGGWHITPGPNFEQHGILDMHVITFISHRLATKKDFPSQEQPAVIGYFPPWDNSYYLEI